MKNLTLKTIMIALKMRDDVDLRIFAKKTLQERYGNKVAAMADAAVQICDEGEYNSFIDTSLATEEGIRQETKDEIANCLKEVFKQTTFPISCIMEMFHSENEFLVKKSKEYVVKNYGKYVYSLIHRHYATFPEKYEEEFYQCGVIGLLKAMQGYNEEKGMFTTYCKRFIQHEISEQANFHRNNTTVHYNNLHKKINEAIAYLKDEGIEPNVQRISIISELKPEIIKRELEYMDRTNFYYLDSDENETDRIAQYSDSPEVAFIKNEQMTSLGESINALPPDEKTVIMMRYEKCTNENIAKKLHVTVGQVKTLYQKGLRMLRSDPNLRRAYPEYLSHAEYEMLQYSMPVAAGLDDISKKIDNLLDIMGTMSESIRDGGDDGLSDLIDEVSGF